jgi:hypothetical protein
MLIVSTFRWMIVDGVWCGVWVFKISCALLLFYWMSSWYVPNITIIFDAPCLFIHHLLCVLLHFMAFYAFSRTNLLMRCHSASSLFLLFLCFRKATQEIFSELDETKAEVPIFSGAWRSPKQRRRGARGRPHHPMARANPWPCRGVVWAPGPLPEAALPPIYSPRRENLRAPINFPRNLL